MAGTIFPLEELHDAQATDWITRARQGVDQFVAETVQPAAQQMQQMGSNASTAVADAVPDMQGFELPSWESLATWSNPERQQPAAPTTTPATMVDGRTQPRATMQPGESVGSVSITQGAGDGFGVLDESSPEAFRQSLADSAQVVADKYDLPWQVVAAIPIQETGFRVSRLGREGNNLFSIKGEGPAGSMQFSEGAAPEDLNTPFRKYNNAAESFDDFGRLITTQPRYAEAVRVWKETRDPARFIEEVQKAGYATDWGDADGTGIPWWQKVVNISRDIPQPARPTARPAATTPMQAEQTPEAAAQADLTPDQAALADPDKWSLCGPVAAVAMARAKGGNFSVEEAKKLAQESGLWDADLGMYGLEAEANLLRKMGYGAKTTQGVDWQQAAADVRNGNPVTLSTRWIGEGHYVVLERMDEQGRFYVGGAGNTLKKTSGRSKWMTPSEIEALGTVEGALFFDNPASPNPSAVAPPWQGEQASGGLMLKSDGEYDPRDADQGRHEGDGLPDVSWRDYAATVEQAAQDTAPEDPTPTTMPMTLVQGGPPTPSAQFTDMGSIPEPTRATEIDPNEGGLRIPARYETVAEGDQQPIAGPEQPEQTIESRVADRLSTAMKPLYDTAGTIIGYVQEKADNALTRMLEGPRPAQSPADKLLAESAARITRPVDEAVGNAASAVEQAMGVPAGTVRQAAEDVSGVLGPEQAINAARTAVRGARGVASEARAAGSALPDVLSRAGEAVDDIGQRVRGAVAPNAERVAAADARMAQQGSTSTFGTAGVAPAAAIEQAAEPAPVFYSQLRRTVEERMPNRATPQQIEGILRGSAVKPDEVTWTGLDDWLREQRRSVTKQEVLDYLDQNAVTVDEVVRGGPGNRGTKFGKYTEPGGENYRELLITRGEPKPAGAWEVFDPADGKAIQGFDTEDAARAFVEQENAAGRALDYAEAGTGSTAVPYVGTHWDEPNVLAHVRFNERTAPDGAKTLLVEEIQSDWHQAGRKHGYQSEGSMTDAQRARFKELADVQYERSLTGSERVEYADLHRRAYPSGNPIGALPDAPFKKTWPELAMKRMVRWAADNGFDRIAWLPGDVQAARYAQDGVDRTAGMSGFYDTILPATAQKLGKKFGARVSTSTIDVEGAAQRVHSLDITPQMRESVIGEGQPLFVSAGAAPGAGSGDPLGAVNRVASQAIASSVSGGVGAQVNQQMNPDDPYAGIKGFAAGALVPPLTAGGVRAGLRRAGREAGEARGAMGLFGTSPNYQPPTPAQVQAAERQAARRGQMLNRSVTAPGSDVPLSVRAATVATDDRAGLRWAEDMLSEAAGSPRMRENDPARPSTLSRVNAGSVADERIARELEPSIVNAGRAGLQDELPQFLEDMHQRDILDEFYRREHQRVLDERAAKIAVAQAKGVSAATIQRMQVKAQVDAEAAALKAMRKRQGGNPDMTYEAIEARLQAQEQRVAAAGKTQELDDAAQAIWDHNAETRQRLVDAGEMDPADAAHYAQVYPHYIPTVPISHLDARGGQSVSASSGPRVSRGNQGVVKALEDVGTSGERLNPIVASRNATVRAERAIQRNNVARAFAQMMDDALQGSPNTMGTNAATHRTFLGGGADVTFFDNGKPVTISVPKSVADGLEAAANMGVSGNGLASIWKRVMGAVTSTMTAARASFLPVNLIRDAQDFASRTMAREGGPQNLPSIMATWIDEAGRAAADIAIAQANPRGFAGAATGAITGAAVGDETTTPAERVRNAAFGGVAGTFLIGANRVKPSGTARVFLERGGGAGALSADWRTGQRWYRDVMRDGGAAIKSPADAARHFGDWLGDIASLQGVKGINERTELISRASAMRRAEKQGNGPVEAMIAGRDASIDFDRAGTWARTMNGLVPFLNATVQGGAQFARTMRRNPVAATASIAATVAPVMLGAEAWNRSDPVRAAVYDDVPQYIQDTGIVVVTPWAGSDNRGERPNYLWIPTGMTTPFVIGMRAAMQNLPGLEPVSGRVGTRADATTADKWLDVFEQVAQVFSPVKGDSAASVASNFVPPIAKQVVELGQNKDMFRGNPIASDSADERSSSFGRTVADATNAAGRAIGNDFLQEVRPSQVDYLARQLPAYGDIITGASDIVAPNGFKQAEDRPIQNAPFAGGVVGRFVRDTGGSNMQRAQGEALSESVREVFEAAGMRPSEMAPVPSRWKNGTLTRDEQLRWQEAFNAEIGRAMAGVRRDPNWRDPAKREKAVKDALSQARELAAERARLPGADAMERRIRAEQRMKTS